MIHEISSHLFDISFRMSIAHHESDFLLCYSEKSIWLHSGEKGLAFPTRRNFPDGDLEGNDTFLFTFHGIPCFLKNVVPEPGCSVLCETELGFFRTTPQKDLAWAALVGYHLYRWYRQNRFCGRCGLKMEPRADERALHCPACASTVYPSVFPAVIVAVVCNGKILLARGAGFSQGWFSLIAGYTNPGESLEETVIREVKEETGLDVWNIRYYKSQPWPLSSSLMVGFVAEADESQPLQPDTREIAEAAWFTPGNLPDHPSEISIAGEMIEKFRRGEL